jgi:hypothetical protein
MSRAYFTDADKNHSSARSTNTSQHEAQLTVGYEDREADLIVGYEDWEAGVQGWVDGIHGCAVPASLLGVKECSAAGVPTLTQHHQDTYRVLH